MVEEVAEIGIENEDEDEEFQLFEYYSLLPPEIRMHIVNQMSLIDRCRYQQCAQRCQIEVKSSKNFIYSLEFDFTSDDVVVVDVMHGDPKIYGPTKGFKMEFRNEHGYIYKIYKDRDEKQLWWKLLDGSMINVVQKMGDLALHYFKDLLTAHQRGLKELSIECPRSDFTFDVDFGVRSLRSLNKLTVEGDFDYLQLISRAPRALNSLTISGNRYCPTLIPQIFNVKKQVTCKNFPLNNEQFLRLRAPVICVDIGQLTVRDLFNFIRSWQNGTMRRNVKRVCWQVTPAFDIAELLALLGRPNVFIRQLQKVTIKHHTDASKRAVMSVKPWRIELRFSTTTRNPDAPFRVHRFRMRHIIEDPLLRFEDPVIIVD